MLMGKVKTV